MGRLLTMVEASKAITERRRILELNGHKPNTQDARYAVAEAQDTKTAQLKDEEWQAKIRQIFEEIDSKMQLERCDPDVMPYFHEYYWIIKEEWQSLKEKYLEVKGE